jgi:hypothetical protein
MKRILLAALVLAAAPPALRAQHVPVPLPADTSRLLPTLHPNLIPQATSRTGAVLNGAIEGAATGAVYALLLTRTEPRCAPSSSARESGVAGAAVGAVWGGLRGLLGLRPRHAPVRTDLPAGTSGVPSLPPVGDSLCRGTLRAVGDESP